MLGIDDEEYRLILDYVTDVKFYGNRDKARAWMAASNDDLGKAPYECDLVELTGYLISTNKSIN